MALYFNVNVVLFSTIEAGLSFFNKDTDHYFTKEKGETKKFLQNVSILCKLVPVFAIVIINRF